jgi:CheY-like chemotaxis protein
VTPRSVLVIDGSTDTDAVLRAVLEPRGARVRRTRSHLPNANAAPRPDVVVIDLDHATDAAARDWASTPQVLLSSQQVTLTDANSRFLEKPFDFPELIRAVEDLLAIAPAA